MAARREELNVTFTANDHLSKKADGAADKLDKLDGRTADATIEATDHASDDIEKVDDKLNKVDGRTATATVDVRSGSGLSDVLGSVDAMPGKLTEGMDVLGGAAGASGAIGLAAGAMVGLVAQATNWGTEVGEVSRLTGASTEDVSRFLTVWKNAGYEKGDLLDVVAQMVGVLNDSPEIADQLGVALDGSMSPLEMMKTAIEGLNSDQISANERILLGSRLFGEEGVRQINGLVSIVQGDLQGALDGVSESQVLSQAEVDKAIEMKRQFTDMVAKVQAVATEIGTNLLPPLERAVELLNDLNLIDGLFPSLDPGSVRESAAAIQVATDRLKEATQWYDIAETEWGDYVAQADNVVTANEEIATGTDGLNDRMAELAAQEDPMSVLSDVWAALINDFRDGSFEFENAAGAVAQLEEATGKTKDEILELIRLEADRQMAALAEGFGAAAEAAGETATAVGGDLVDAVNDAVGAALDHAAAIRDEEIAALEAEQEALEATIETLEGYIDAQRSAYDTQIDYREATEDAEDALADYNNALVETDDETGELIASQEEINDLGEDFVQSVLDQSDALIDQQAAQAAANGEIYTGTQRIEDQNAALLATASTIPNELLPQFAEMITSINGIPEEKETILRMLQEGADPDAILLTLNSMSGTRKAAIQVEANQTEINNIANQLTALTQPRTVRIHTVRDDAHRAAGGPVSAGSPYVVGERGQELFVPEQDGTIIPAGQTSAMLSGHLTPAAGFAGGGGASAHYDVNINMPPGSNGQDVLRALQQLQRQQGPLPIRVASVG